MTYFPGRNSSQVLKCERTVPLERCFDLLYFSESVCPQWVENDFDHLTRPRLLPETLKDVASWGLNSTARHLFSVKHVSVGTEWPQTLKPFRRNRSGNPDSWDGGGIIE